MPSPTLAQILAGQTQAQYLAQIKTGLSPAFPVTTWRDGDVAQTLAQIDAQALSDLAASVALVAMGGYVTTQPGVTGAAGAWLDLAAQNVYALTRNQAVQTIGTVTLTDAASAGPFTLSVGQIWLTDGTHRYNSTGGGVLPKGGTLTLSFGAESPGAAYNSAGALAFVTPLPGVTLSALTITQQGTDAESDIALAQRCIGRWPALGSGATAAAYDAWARTASAEVTRTKVQADGTTAGQVDIYLAGASGPVSGGAVTAVQNYLTPRLPLSSTLSVVNATATTITVGGTVYISSAYLAASTAAVGAALTALFQSIPIGGTVYLSAVIEAIMSPPGLRNCAVTINSGSADIALGATAVASLTQSLTFTGV